MSKKINIVIIGSGNTAWNLGTVLHKKGFTIEQVYSRVPAHAKALAKELGCGACSKLKDVNRGADVYLLAVSDDAIGKVVRSLRLTDKVVIHTSGSVEMNALKKASPHCGVIYPLQTLSRGRPVDLHDVPLCVEYSSPKAKSAVHTLAKSISRSVHPLPSRQRAFLHLAAVIAGNFSNHLYAQAAKVLAKQHIPFSLLEPYLLENVKKAAAMGPASAQTGPARRGDKKILKKHLAMLDHDPGLKKLYRILSAGIAHFK